MLIQGNGILFDMTEDDLGVRDTEQMRTPESILQKVDSINDDIREWNRLNKKYKSEDGVADMLYEPPISVFDQETELQIMRTGILPSQITGSQLKINHIHEKIEAERKRLQDRGIIPRNETPQSERPEFTPFTAPIEGLVEKQGVDLILTETRLQAMLEELVPTHFRGSIDAIIFKTSDKYPEYWIDGSPYIIEKKKEMVVGEIIETVLHEIGEAVIINASLNGMRSWEEAVREDHNNGVQHISEYSKFVSETQDPEIGEKEDFCDSFAMFMQRPRDLQVTAPARFNAIMQLVTQHMPERDAELFRIKTGKLIEEQKQASPFSDLEVKQMILRHQTIDVVSAKNKGDVFTNGTYLPRKNSEDNRYRGTIEIYLPPYARTGKKVGGKIKS